MPSSRRAAVAARLRAYVLVPDAVSQMRITDQPHRRTCPLPCPLGAVSISSRASPVRSGTRSSGGVSSAKCSTRSPASQAAVFLGQVPAQLLRAVARHVGEGRRLGGAKPIGGTVCLVVAVRQRPRRMVSPARDRQARLRRPRRSRAASPGPLLPRSGRGWLAPNSPARRNAQQDFAAGRPCTGQTRQETRAGGSTPIGAAPARRREAA